MNSHQSLITIHVKITIFSSKITMNPPFLLETSTFFGPKKQWHIAVPLSLWVVASPTSSVRCPWRCCLARCTLEVGGKACLCWLENASKIERKSWYINIYIYIYIYHIYILHWKLCCSNMIWLVVYLPLWKIWKSVGMIIPNWMENKQCSKPPTSYIYSIGSCGAAIWWIDQKAISYKDDLIQRPGTAHYGDHFCDVDPNGTTLRQGRGVFLWVYYAPVKLRCIPQEKECVAGI